MFRCLFPDGFSSSKPCSNVNPYSTATVIKSKNPLASIDPIMQLINQVTSMDLEVSKVALTKLDKMLIIPNVSIMFNFLMYLLLIINTFILCRQDQNF